MLQSHPFLRDAHSQVGFIPIMELLVSVVTCHDASPSGRAPDAFWPRMGFQCFVGGHAVYAAFALTLASLFVACMAIFVLVFVETHPLLPGLHGRTSGRAGLIMLLWKVRKVIGPRRAHHAALEGA